MLATSGVDLSLLAGGSQSVVVICRPTYELDGGGWVGRSSHVSFYLQKGLC